MTPQGELIKLLMLDPATTTDATLQGVVTEKCNALYKDFVEEHGLTFSEIIEDNNVQVKEYFDGRGNYNSRRETLQTTFGNTDDILSIDPGAKIRKIKGMYAGRYPFVWPGESAFGEASDPVNVVQNFDTCDYNTAMCCWTQGKLNADFIHARRCMYVRYSL